VIARTARLTWFEGDRLGRAFDIGQRLSRVASDQRRSIKEGVDSDAQPASSRRVVIVEDDKDAREALAELLELMGHEVSTAADGVAGRDLILAVRPDLALVDVGLPGMNGYEVASALRAAPGLEGTKLVALTGYGRETEPRALAAGFCRQMTKPLDFSALENLLR